MKILSPEQMREIEHKTINLLGLSEEVLMERAGMAVARSIRRFYPHCRKIVALAGKGNNGGDALVALRDLVNESFQLHVILLSPPEKCGESVRREVSRLSALGVKSDVLGSPSSWHRISHAEVLIDGVLGTGMSGVLPRDLADMFERINRMDKKVVAVDIPSGVDGESGKVDPEAIKACVTVTMAFPKWGLFLDPGHRYTGKVIVSPIGIPDFPDPVSDIIMGSSEASRVLPVREPYFHKGNVGHVGIWGGDPGKRGAPELAALGALRAGSGLATVHWRDGEAELIPRNPEIMIVTGNSPADTLFGKVDVLAMGPGWDPDRVNPSEVRSVLDVFEGPVLADAGIFDVFRLQAGNLKRKNGRPLVLTPHPGEISRLLDIPVKDILANSRRIAGETARLTGAVVVLKGWRTIIASPDGQCAVNPTGAPNMATAGMGDVLTGVISSFLGQGLEPFNAALAGVYVHGLAGEIAWKRGVRAGLLAHELAGLLPVAMTEIVSAGPGHPGEDCLLFEPLEG